MERWGVGAKGVRDWVSSDCVSGQLHMFLIKVLTLWEQLHTRMLVFVIRPDVLWSGGSPENTAGSGPARLGSARIKPRTAGSHQPSLTRTPQCGHTQHGWMAAESHMLSHSYPKSDPFFSPHKPRPNLSHFFTPWSFLPLFSLLRF